MKGLFAPIMSGLQRFSVNMVVFEHLIVIPIISAVELWGETILASKSIVSVHFCPQFRCHILKPKLETTRRTVGVVAANFAGPVCDIAERTFG